MNATPKHWQQAADALIARSRGLSAEARIVALEEGLRMFARHLDNADPPGAAVVDEQESGG